MDNNINSFIELRQQDASLINSNGDYNCNLTNEIVLNKGDQITLKSVFIDTKKQGYINITNDLNLTFQNTIYLTDWNFDNTNKINMFNEEGPPTCSGSCLDFIPMKLTVNGVLPNAETITNAIYKAPTGGGGSEPFTATYQYKDYFTGQTIYLHRAIPGVRTGGEYVDNIDVLCAENSFSLLTPTAHDILYIYGMEPPTFTSTTGNIPNDIYTPFIFTNNIIVPKGSYDANDLTLFISKELSRNNSTNSLIQTTLKSPYLKSSQDFLQGKPSPDGAKNPDGTPYLLTADCIYLSTDMSKVMRIPTGANYSIGSSQIALEVSTSNKVQWSYLHYPMYDDVDGNAISVRYIAQTLNNDDDPSSPVYTGNIIPVSKCGGIIWTGLNATDTITGNSVDFFENVLGFNLATLCPPIGQITEGNYYNGIEGTFNMFYPLGQVLQRGINMTDGYFGLDSIIEKKPNTFYKITTPTSIDNPIISTVDTTNAIIADNSQDVLLNSFSHFILETNLKLNNMYIGAVDTYHNYSGVITKYYSFGNYSYSGDGEGAFVYTHTGNNPIYLKSISIRILNSDKTPASSNIGEDNTIILQVVKNV